MNSTRHVLLALVFVLSSAVPFASAAPEKGSKAKAKAKEHFDKGVALVAEGNFEDAVGEFEESYGLVHAYPVLYNIAMCYRALGDREKAVSFLEQFIEKGGKAIGEARLAEVEALLHLLKANEAVLTVVCHPDGATVSFDGVELGECPLESVHVPAGKHVILAQKQGYEPLVEEVDLEAGSRESRVLMLDEI